MSDIVSKISLYDILAMIVPGCILLWCIAMISGVSNWVENCECIQFITVHQNIPQTLCFSAIFLILAYVVGLINFMVISWIWQMIPLGIRPQWIWKYLQDNVFKWKMNCTKQLLIDKAIIEANAEGIREYKKDDAATIKDAYFEAYTYASQNTENNTVPIIENQVAMLRSLIIPLSLLMAMNCNQWWVSVMVGLLIVTILTIAAILRIKKIYTIVFENYEYAKRTEK